MLNYSNMNIKIVMAINSAILGIYTIGCYKLGMEFWKAKIECNKLNLK